MSKDRDDRQPMKDQTCIVTGANSGLGKASALLLAQSGARVVMLCRSQERGEARN